jgi:OmpA-OmpF porin, OOP family
MNWVAVSGTFVANGTETFLTIGNFKSDANTDTLRTPFSSSTIGGWSQLLIDDVSVIEVKFQ